MKELAVIKYDPVQYGGNNDTTVMSSNKKKNPINNINKYFSIMKIGLKLAPNSINRKE